MIHQGSIPPAGVGPLLFHAAARAVVDAAKGVQHVFVYSGFPGGPAGVFRITRTLDTPLLAQLLAEKRPSAPAR